MQSIRVIGFDPIANVLHFENDYPPGTTEYSFKLFGKTIKLGDASNGLCGGFVYTVKDCFEAGLLPPADVARPAAGSPLFNYLVARLTNSFDESDVNQYLSWIQMTDGDTLLGTGISHHEITEEWPKIKADLDSNHLSPLGLVHGSEPPAVGFFTGIQDLGGCHQVLAWGYDLEGTQLTIHIYDPDNAGGNNTIALDIANPGKPTPLKISNWNSSQYRGFFRTHYNYHDPRTPASGAFIETVVTSPGLKLPGPVARPWNDATWLSAAGNPLIRFTGGVHQWTGSVRTADSDSGRPILQLRTVVMTGGDDLRGGTNPRDNCDATVTFRDGASATIRNINDNQHWGNNETHTVVLPIPDKYVAGDIVKFALSTNFGGGLSGDNWNVNHVSLVASLTGSRKVIPPMPNPVARTWLSSNGNPIVRFTGSTRDWGAQIEVAADDKTRVIENLQLTIQTGGDDLRGGSDNASVLLTFGGNQVTTANINAGAHWNNNETHTVALNFPAGAKAGDLARFDLHTQFGGGTGGDNWNVNKLVLEATLSG